MLTRTTGRDFTKRTEKKEGELLTNLKALMLVRIVGKKKSTSGPTSRRLSFVTHRLSIDDTFPKSSAQCLSGFSSENGRHSKENEAQ